MGTVTWRTKTLKRKSDAPNHVGSGDWLGHWSLLKNILVRIIKKNIHSHQLCVNLIVGIPRLKLPRNKSSGCHLASLNVLVEQKTTDNLAHKAMNLRNSVLDAPTSAQLTHQTGCGNRCCAQPIINIVCHVALL